VQLSGCAGATGPSSDMLTVANVRKASETSNSVSADCEMAPQILSGIRNNGIQDALQPAPERRGPSKARVLALSIYSGGGSHHEEAGIPGLRNGALELVTMR